MPTTHTTDSGLTYTLLEPELVPEKKRRPVAYKLVEVSNAFEDVDSLPTDPDAVMSGEAPKKADIEVADLQMLDDLNDLVAVALLESWSSDQPISVESLTSLSSGDYRHIRQAVAPFVFTMMPDFSPSPVEDSPTSP